MKNWSSKIPLVNISSLSVAFGVCLFYIHPIKAESETTLEPLENHTWSIDKSQNNAVFTNEDQASPTKKTKDAKSPSESHDTQGNLENNTEQPQLSEKNPIIENKSLKALEKASSVQSRQTQKSKKREAFNIRKKNFRIQSKSKIKNKQNANEKEDQPAESEERHNSAPDKLTNASPKESNKPFDKLQPKAVDQDGSLQNEPIADNSQESPLFKVQASSTLHPVQHAPLSRLGPEPQPNNNAPQGVVSSRHLPFMTNTGKWAGNERAQQEMEQPSSPIKAVSGKVNVQNLSPPPSRIGPEPSQKQGQKKGAAPAGSVSKWPVKPIVQEKPQLSKPPIDKKTEPAQNEVNAQQMPASDSAMDNREPAVEAEQNAVKEEPAQAADRNLLNTMEKRPVDEIDKTSAKKYLINFNNVNIVEYINFISAITKQNFIFDNADLEFNVTIVSAEPTTIDDIMHALLQELRIHNLSMMEVGNNIIIHRNPQAQSPGTIVTGSESSNRINSELITRVFTLQSASPANIADVVKPLLSNLAIVEPVPDTGHLIITDISANIERIEQLIKAIDTPMANLEIATYNVKYGDVNGIIDLAQRIIAPIAQGKPVVFVPHSIHNSIYIISTPTIIKKVMSILPSIDAPRFPSGGNQQEQDKKKPGEKESKTVDLTDGINEDELEQQLQQLQQQQQQANYSQRWQKPKPLGHEENTNFYLYKLQYRQGDDIREALSNIGDSLLQASKQETDLITTINSIQYLEASNSLVFTGTTASIEKVKEFIVQIDIPLRQVLIELLIIETTVNNALSIGVDWGTRFGGGDSAGSQAFLSSNSPLPAALDTTVPGGSVDASGLARQAGFNIGVIGREVVMGGFRFNSFGALVNALNTNSQTNVIMNPKLLVEENSPAEVFAGINTRFQSQAISNDEGSIVTSNYEFRDVGSTFKVTPSISASNMITIIIDQEVSNVVSSGDGSSGSDGSTTGGTQNNVPTATNTVSDVGPTTRRSTTKTKIHVPNGYFVILSGIISDQKNRSRVQIPCLGGIPGLGGIFSQKSNDSSKRNLLLFIRPIIIEDDEIDHQTKREQDMFDNKSRLKKMWDEEIQETLDLLNLKNTNPHTQY